MGCASSTQNVSAPTISLPKEALENSNESVIAEENLSFFDKYVLGGKLGKGGFAQVRAIADDDDLAVKVMDLRREDKNGRLIDCQKAIKVSREEVDCWQAAGIHPNIVGLLDAYFEHGASFFVMERCDLSFLSYLQNGAGKAYLNEWGLATCFSQLLSGLVHIHKQGVVHRDIKPDNVMVAGNLCKLCDFGLAGILGDIGTLRGTYGTAPFMSPEMLNKTPYGTEADVWSIGVMAYVLFYGAFPYEPEIKSSAEMKKVIREGLQVPAFKAARGAQGANKISPLPGVSVAAENWVRTLLNRDQKTRITAADALNLDFMQMGASEEKPTYPLPCLTPVLSVAMKSGAFENRRLDKVDGALDPLLAKLHRRATGTTLMMGGDESPRKPRAKGMCSSDASTATGTSSSPACTVSLTPAWQTHRLSSRLSSSATPHESVTM